MAKTKKQRQKDFRQGELVRIDTRLSDPGADEHGPQLHLEGKERGRVIGANPEYCGQHDGEERVTVQLESGGIVAAPTSAVRRDNSKAARVAFRMTDDTYTRLFGHPPRQLADD